MNKKGHPQTLVAAQQGNTNAAKAGVFSDRLLAPRIHELEQAIEERGPSQVTVDALRREVASLLAISEAMDESLATTGVTNRQGEPLTMIALRMRISERLQRALERYTDAHRATGSAPSTGDEAVPLTLPETIADHHDRRSITDIAPQELDLEASLRAFILSPDPSITTRDRHRARKMLTRRLDKRPDTCMCFSTLATRDETVFEQWVAESRDGGSTPDPTDGSIAACVRRLQERDRDHLPVPHDKMLSALEAVIAAARARAQGAPEENPPQLHIDVAVAPFFETVLSRDIDVRPADRLDALDALDELGVIQHCTCVRKRSMLRAQEIDEWVAFVIGMVARRNRRSAGIVAQYPATFAAVRAAIDDVALNEMTKPTAAEDENAAA